MSASPILIDRPVSVNVFKLGGVWMCRWLSVLENKQAIQYDVLVHFNAYGFMKYGICITAFVVSFWCFYTWNIYLTPLSILVFYIAEVHFLFLFPLLIDKVERPVLKSIAITYRMGLVHVLLKVIPLGFYMAFGLFRFSDPFRNWYKGCLAVLIWYQDEVRDRI